MVQRYVTGTGYNLRDNLVIELIHNDIGQQCMSEICKVAWSDELSSER